jgi:uncharacterized protein (TIGR03435 family)
MNDPTLFSVHNTSLKSLILRADDIQDYQLSGGPAQMENDRDDIDPRPEDPAAHEQTARSTSHYRVLTIRYGTAGRYFSEFHDMVSGA